MHRNPHTIITNHTNGKERSTWDKHASSLRHSPALFLMPPRECGKKANPEEIHQDEKALDNLQKVLFFHSNSP